MEGIEQESERNGYWPILKSRGKSESEYESESQMGDVYQPLLCHYEIEKYKTLWWFKRAELLKG